MNIINLSSIENSQVIEHNCWRFDEFEQAFIHHRMRNEKGWMFWNGIAYNLEYSFKLQHEAYRTRNNQLVFDGYESHVTKHYGEYHNAYRFGSWGHEGCINQGFMKGYVYQPYGLIEYDNLFYFHGNPENWLLIFPGLEILEEDKSKFDKVISLLKENKVLEFMLEFIVPTKSEEMFVPHTGGARPVDHFLFKNKKYKNLSTILSKVTFEESKEVLVVSGSNQYQLFTCYKLN